MDIIGQSLDRHVDRVNRRANLLVAGYCEIRLVDLEMLAASIGQAPKVLMQQLAEVSDHPDRVVIVFVVSDRGEKMRTGHGDLDRLAGERRDSLEIPRPIRGRPHRDRSSANRRRMKNIWIVLGDRLGARLPLK